MSRDANEILGVELGGQLGELASSLGLTKAAYLRALFVGSLRLGLAERCVLSAIEKGWVDKPREGPDHDMPRWRSTTVNPDFRDPAFVPHRSAVWVRDDGYRLERLGPPSRSPSDPGWGLTGPGIEVPMQMGQTRKEAMRRANAIIRDMTRT